MRGRARRRRQAGLRRPSAGVRPDSSARMGALVWLVILPLLLLAALLGGGLYLNKLPWDDPPGFSSRLTTYLDQHVAETAEGSPFPELRPRHYADLTPDALFAIVEQAVQGMPNWTLAARDAKMR